mmetsp:Transcript_4199/g.10906  ORF Transcript_4199/g.10906 Transcript_4199/m.10906 type:complete len:240 (+) Transcript_4199:1092-1811(+)
MTTIGYGDIAPTTATAKLVSSAYLPLGVLALADAVSDVQMISLRRSIRETDFNKLADECLLRDAVRGEHPEINSVLTEAEFLVDQLKINGLVDSAAVTAINKQFTQLTKRGKFSGDTRRLTPKMVYEEIRHRVREGKELSRGSTVADIRDNGFRWKSFEDWHRTSWQARVSLAHEAKLQSKELPVQSSGSGPRLNSIVGVLLSLPGAAMSIIPGSWQVPETPVHVERRDCKEAPSDGVI